MERPSMNQDTVRFGLFEVDLQARELRKCGVKVKLNDQPFQVLSMLLERAGEVVPREELQAKLWPSDTFVDFDLSLNSAIKKLRQALQDESDNPRFVETLYRRGYRFIAPISTLGRQELSSAVTVEATPHVLRDPAGIKDGSGLLPSSHRREQLSKRIGTQLFLFCAVLAVLGAVTFILLHKSNPRITGFTQLTSGGKVHEMTALVTDGERLYFQAAENDRVALAEVSVSGGESKLVPTPFQSTFLGDIAPDGASLSIVNFADTSSNKKSATWILPLPAGSARPLGTWSSPAIWSPDGHHLLVTDGADLFETNVDGSQGKKLATLIAPIAGARISPDGLKIRMTLFDIKTNSSQLWELKRDGSGAHPLLPGWNDPPKECCGRWTADGKYFLFSSLREGRGSLWVLPERHWWFRPKPVQLTNGPLDFWLPVPSNDGKKIFAMGGLPRSEVLRYDGRSFVPFLSGASASDLAFSADGKRVAYVSIPEQILWSSKVDGSDRIQLSPSGAGGVETMLPRWSPDGTQIVFMARTPGTDWRAYLVSANGQGFRELIPGATAGFDPGWSPDGKSIVLAMGDLGATSNDISILDLATGKVSPIPGGKELFGPRWSPDGRYIAAATTDSQALMLFDRASQKWTELARIGVGYPSWSRDGQYIYLDAIFTEDPAFFRVRISDRKLEQVASLKGIHRFWGQAAEWSGLAPDDSPLVTRDISSPEIYALDWQP